MGLLISASLTHAAPFNFSYNFDNGTAVAGSLDGTRSGDYVTNVSNVSLTINGNSVGPFDVWGYYGEVDYGVSFDATLNNFWFAEEGVWDGHTYSGSNGSYGFALIGSAITTDRALNHGNDYDYIHDQANSVPATPFPGGPMNDSWSLNAVPDTGSTAALLGAGVVAIAFARRRLG